MTGPQSLPKVDSYNFSVQLKTRLSDEDNQRILNHATYVSLIEEARLLYLTECGVMSSSDAGNKLPFVQHSSNIRYVNPGKGASKCVVDVRTLHLGVSSFIQMYRVRGATDNLVWVECVQTLCMWQANSRKTLAITSDQRKKIASFEGNLHPEKAMELPADLANVCKVTRHPGPYRCKLAAKTRWVDEDKNGVLSGSVYWTLMEEGRADYFSSHGLNLLLPSGSFPFVLHSSNMRYYKPGNGGKNCFVDVRTLFLGSSSFSQHYRVRSADTGDIWCEATQVFVMWDVEAKKKMKMPDAFRRVVAEYEGLPVSPPAKPAAVTVNMADTNKTVLEVGDTASLTKQFGQGAVDAFAQLSEDRNPLHLDAAFAANTRFKQQIVHGALSSSLFSGLLGLHLPGPGTVYLSQTSNFKAPLLLGQPVTATVTVKHVRKDKPVVTLATQAVDGSGKVLVDGEAVVMVPRAKAGLPHKANL
mmetsp:Transcript_11601/g.22065  ORF Transcript_11601/g.22065 Transcript_11601/m.22065 type:complete len:472 (+) Transcript_11601:59-1474(+)